MLTAAYKTGLEKKPTVWTLGVVESAKIVQIVRLYAGLTLDGPNEVGTTDGVFWFDVVWSWDLCLLLQSSEEGIRKGRYEL